MNYEEEFKNLPRTPWFLGSVKPVYVGVYERYMDATRVTLLSYWDGEYWLAGVHPYSLKSYHQQNRWRGCSFDTTKT